MEALLGLGYRYRPEIIELMQNIIAESEHIILRSNETLQANNYNPKLIGLLREIREREQNKEWANLVLNLMYNFKEMECVQNSQNY